MGKLRIGVVGVGRHGSRYARHAARDVDELELVAVCRRDREAGTALAAELGCDYVDDAHALISRDDIEAVILVTVPALLEELIVDCAQRGKRLLVEKPVAPDAEVGRRLLRVLEESGSYCMVGHTLRFNSICKALRREVSSLGRLDTLLFSQRFPPQLDIEWLDQPARSGGGNILHTGVHCFDLIRFITALAPTTAACELRSVCTKATEDSFVAQLGFEGTVLASITCSRSTHSRNGLIEISGEHGQLVGDHVLGTLYRIGPDGREDVAVDPPTYTVLETLRRFAADWATDKGPAIEYRDGLIAVCIADACYRSARSGRREEIVMPDVRP